MSLAYASAVLDVDLATAWSVLGDFHGMADWIGRIRRSVPEGGAGAGSVGSVRRIALEPDGQEVGERLVSYDGPGHRYSYEFAGTIPFPVRSYRGTVHLLPVTAVDGTFIEWFGEYECDAPLVEPVHEQFIGIYTEFIGDLRAHLGRRSTG